jgi:hypothetical protein
MGIAGYFGLEFLGEMVEKEEEIEERRERKVLLYDNEEGVQKRGWYVGEGFM